MHRRADGSGRLQYLPIFEKPPVLNGRCHARNALHFTGKGLQGLQWQLAWTLIARFSRRQKNVAEGGFRGCNGSEMTVFFQSKKLFKEQLSGVYSFIWDGTIKSVKTKFFHLTI